MNLLKRDCFYIGYKQATWEDADTAYGLEYSEQTLFKRSCPDAMTNQVA